jgi:hypothetical protein
LPAGFLGLAAAGLFFLPMPLTSVDRRSEGQAQRRDPQVL